MVKTLQENQFMTVDNTKRQRNICRDRIDYAEYFATKQDAPLLYSALFNHRY